MNYPIGRVLATTALFFLPLGTLADDAGEGLGRVRVMSVPIKLKVEGN